MFFDYGPAAASEFATVIDSFSRMTGVPILLDTSYNDEEPIVETLAHGRSLPSRHVIRTPLVRDYVIERA
ncbi:hypothetical protein J7I98_39325 [Streptomyces sp. ISL-98]|uniref:carbamoyltransferase C-terminal domain-containing protein n=1 Tax=Streptomyces sp. ISL-98 TaxID=2819192 RepID=UPI001BE7F7B7|nr:carbamoyltransferase C-terminal domain-containing protein [Streptomyces sp. ISL-98]MBT2511724.1 hypothetical protein [Streptomyces sp. ISL-98]